ncbi:hypothetical protein [Meiothermus granaticius]|uniref:Uncharacterized protein n=1 Tax=Meiothermus granaticius NBRC 107808 TaxID=1227551 RepID=A0A399F513_9DEIN|nr:hypothetical protein [Meiothermus granaticius]RIH91153.1 hypothetical protein Mgrana_02937 [Meiothermus granaticius NBRC 107808]GEM88353.1 hypothetical protein MGR01S_29780 [Meiothermus granaticius NBRC 107808]
MKSNMKDKYSLVRLGKEVFPTRPHWDLEVLEGMGLPLYWNPDWLREELQQTGSTLALAQKWNYPWGEVNRLAQYFGMTLPKQRVWASKFFLMDKELIKKVDRVRGKQSRNRWIVSALESYLREKKEQEARGKQQAN